MDTLNIVHAWTASVLKVGEWDKVNFASRAKTNFVPQFSSTCGVQKSNHQRRYKLNDPMGKLNYIFCN